MENNQCSSQKSVSIQEEKFVRQIDYDSITPTAVSSRAPQQELRVDLEIFNKQPSQRVHVLVKPRIPAIKTLYIAEKNRFYSPTGSEKSCSRSRLGIGDHSSFNSFKSTYLSTYAASNSYCEEHIATTTCTVKSGVIVSSTDLVKSGTISICTQAEQKPAEKPRDNIYNDKLRSPEKCYVYTQPQFTLNLPRVEAKAEKSKYSSNKTDIATLIVTNTSSDDNAPVSISTIKKLNKRIDHLERKLIKQEMVLHSLNPNLQLQSSDEDECKEAKRMDASDSARPGCSYVQQYSRIPETSAFQRYAQQGSSLSASKATTLDKERKSEKYGRDFTTYDGITARGRRQSASVPCKRGDFPQNMAAERVHKIRHKLNPVRDYRLMDTVHFLAQGEFAPRDDGIKLTPSREAVLSDIIWEDVCRTHWPNARLGRRTTQPERCNTRCELQRLIDSLLRERVAHVERRRRRHYRIVKLNHRHESCRPLGKTGDIIVASHKHKDGNDERNVPISELNAASAMISDRRWEESSSRRSYRSHDRMKYEDNSYRHKRRVKEDECIPGPSYASNRGPSIREPMCCYHSVSPPAVQAASPAPAARDMGPDISSSSNCGKPATRNPRLIVRKETGRNKRHKEEPNLDQYILLPTLVIRTPSNVKRQKKFNELYHRILNVHTTNSAQGCGVNARAVEPITLPKPDKKDIGLNVNILQSASEDNMKKK
ncbi:hypothetical protein NE865_03606 [Phthorimaea operculella]|nr:hypothetical protein NE865_03606 [Phthorimaea operculella]